MKTASWSSLGRSAWQALAVLLVLLGTGCGGTYPLHITRGPLPAAPTRRAAPITVAPFKDTRSVAHKSVLGVAKGGFGDHWGDFVVEHGQSLDRIMQSFFEEALRSAGYEIAPVGRAPVVIEGEVFEWWLEHKLNFVNRVGILVRVRDRNRGTILWEKEIRGREDDLLVPQNAVRAAMDVTLANAVREFSSLEFYEAVERRNRRALGQ